MERLPLMHPTLQTGRLILREWRDDDVAPFSAMSTNPLVMQYLTKLPDRSAIERWVDDVRAHFRRHGFGLWAIEIPGIAPFVGFTGLTVVPYEAHFTPAIEVAWRLSPEYWRKGLVAEAATTALNVGFRSLEFQEIMANAAINNSASIRVMERLGMNRNPDDDFDHPLKPPQDPLRRQVLFRIGRKEWLTRHERSIRPLSLERLSKPRTPSGSGSSEGMPAPAPTSLRPKGGPTACFGEFTLTGILSVLRTGFR
jgi:RimJ/RimL family protein N-acetyltransferase